MEVSKDVVDVIYQLLPGFVAAWIFYGLTAHPKAAPFERVVQALIFTTIAKVCVIALKWLLLYVGAHWFMMGKWTDDLAFCYSVLCAVMLGLLCARWSNNNTIHNALRENKLYDWIRSCRGFRWLPNWEWTCRTSSPSEWYSAFHQQKRFLILHLKGERRLHGWAMEWPDHPDRGHFVMVRCSWLLKNGKIGKLYTVSHMLVPASQVEEVEFLKDPDEVTASNEEIQAVEKLLVSIQESGDTNGSKVPAAAAEGGCPEGGESGAAAEGIQRESEFAAAEDSSAASPPAAAEEELA